MIVLLQASIVFEGTFAYKKSDLLFLQSLFAFSLKVNSLLSLSILS